MKPCSRTLEEALDSKDQLLKDLEDKIKTLSLEVYNLAQEKMHLETELKENNRGWDNLFEEEHLIFQEELRHLEATYQLYLMDFIKANPNLGLTSNHEMVRNLTTKYLEQQKLSK